MKMGMTFGFVEYTARQTLFLQQSLEVENGRSLTKEGKTNINKSIQ